MQTFRQIIFLLVGAIVFAMPVSATAQNVTYSWTTTNQGYGTHVDQPTTATFDVPLTAVQSGVIGYADISNIQLAYPGLSLDFFTPTSIGLDNAAYVDPTTGTLLFNNNNQGLGVVGYEGNLFSDTFLSITFGNPVSGAVSDQFNSLKNGAPFAGYPTAGFWSATLPTVGGAVPEPATWAMMLFGFAAVGFAMRRRKQQVTVSYA